MDSISREELIEAILEARREETDTIPKLIRFIEQRPTIEPKTGHWEITDAYPHNVYCSECHTRCAQTHWAVWEDGSLPRNYCPNCGARMGARYE